MITDKINNKQNKNDWYKTSGFQRLIRVPVSLNQELGIKIKSNIEEITKDKILIQEILGNNIVNTLRKPNPDPPSRCHCQDCKPCLHGTVDMKCYKPNAGYRIVCNRSPCSDSLIMTVKELQTERLRNRIQNLPPGVPKPSVYEGTTHRSLY